MQTELTKETSLLDEDGNLVQVGWARYPLLDCNLENVAFYPRYLNALQFLRVKRWDYYAVFTPRFFISATIADLGYAGNIFVYILDLNSKVLYEEGLVIPLGRGITLSRQTEGICEFLGRGVHLKFQTSPEERYIFVNWPGFHDGRGIHAEICLHQQPDHESMNIVIPIQNKRFYYNHKINCLPATGYLKYGDIQENLEPGTSLGQLDWGRGVWAYRSCWNWASASGFLPDGRTAGLNFGSGFGNTSAATENALIIDKRVYKLDQVTFDYNADDFMQPWKFQDNEGRLDLVFIPFTERVATTKLILIDSEVHQIFGHYTGQIVAHNGEKIAIDRLIGFAEEHKARW